MTRQRKNLFAFFLELAHATICNAQLSYDKMTSTTHDYLTKAQTAAAHYRALLKEKADLEDRLQRANAELKKYSTEDLPDLMDQAGIDRIGLPSEGNLPACDLTMVPFYRALIPAEWPPDRRQAAFDALSRLGHEDLIKTDIIISLPRHERRTAMRILAMLEQFNCAPSVRENVHHKTLTAWLQEQFEGRKPLPPLDVIGASIGRVVNLKERR